jgi:hypothetical protein
MAERAEIVGQEFLATKQGEGCRFSLLVRDRLRE